MNEEEFLLTAATNCSKTDIILNRRKLSSDEEVNYRIMKYRRSKGEPLQYAAGFTEFLGCKIFVDERVLIPRPETEIMVEKIIEQIKQNNISEVNILDVGTGSGNIAIALAKNIKNAEITAIDKSKDSIDLAKYNSEYNLVNDRIKFINVSFENYVVQNNPLKFDIIVSNPPYIPENDLNNLPDDVKREPFGALNGGKNGVEIIEKIIINSSKMLKENGMIFLEIGDNQNDLAEEIIKNTNAYKNIRFFLDYVGTRRIVSAEVR